LIATTAASNPGTPNTVTTAGVNTTGANLIVVMAGYDAGFSGTSSAIPVVTDNMGNGSYTGLPRQNSALGNAGNLFYFANPTVGSGHTFTLTGTIPFQQLPLRHFLMRLHHHLIVRLGLAMLALPASTRWAEVSRHRQTMR
jgi:hypothetical protein